MEKTGTLLEITSIMKESLDAEQNQQTHWQQNSLHSENVTGNDTDGLLGGRIFV